MIYAAITPTFSNVTRYSKVSDYYDIYEKIMFITENNHEISEDAASWCELAYIGATYEHEQFTIEIIED